MKTIENKVSKTQKPMVFKAFIVTGTPGTGKTTFAKEFAKEKRFTYVDGKQIIAKNNLEEEYVEEKQTATVDEQEFAKVCEDIIQKSEQSLVIDSHLSQFINPKFVEKCFVTMCDISVLKKRLEERGYLADKVRDNLDAEIFQECKLEAEELGHKVQVVKTG